VTSHEKEVGLALRGSQGAALNLNVAASIQPEVSDKFLLLAR